ncbi:MAG: hypothetical protein JWL62_1742 [Hyphomicrobiales bacterium]|nr:hypothetical protein [Hyphomicrobiales bacterium]
MELPELRRVSDIAAGLDKLVPQIGQAIRAVDAQSDHARLMQLLKNAEGFLLAAGPVISRAKLEAGIPRQLCERFMRELPRRLRMIRDAQAPAARSGDNLVPFPRDTMTAESRRG